MHGFNIYAKIWHLIKLAFDGNQSQKEGVMTLKLSYVYFNKSS